ncbi:MAG: hypothetical protein GX029_02850 [Pseudomonadaceae bacterium]|nr:hypothetical protein [Pseudomonadaceae bacterium]
MTTDLILQSLRQAYWLRKRPKRVIFHSDCGSQYTSKLLKKELVKMKITPSMGYVGACRNTQFSILKNTTLVLPVLELATCNAFALPC